MPPMSHTSNFNEVVDQLIPPQLCSALKGTVSDVLLSKVSLTPQTCFQHRGVER